MCFFGVLDIIKMVCGENLKWVYGKWKLVFFICMGNLWV